jgi:hypothetical protein
MKKRPTSAGRHGYWPLPVVDPWNEDWWESQEVKV